MKRRLLLVSFLGYTAVFFWAVGPQPVNWSRFWLGLLIYLLFSWVLLRPLKVNQELESSLMGSTITGSFRVALQKSCSEL